MAKRHSEKLFATLQQLVDLGCTSSVVVFDRGQEFSTRQIRDHFWRLGIEIHYRPPTTFRSKERT